MESEFEKEKEAPKEKLPDSNPLTNLLTLNNFIDFSDRISKLELENESFKKSHVLSEQLIERFERQNDDLKNQLSISQNQQMCLQDSLEISKNRNLNWTTIMYSPLFGLAHVFYLKPISIIVFK